MPPVRLPGASRPQHIHLRGAIAGSTPLSARGVPNSDNISASCLKAVLSQGRRLLMLIACSRYGEVQAYDVHLEDGPFHCPSCHAQVILKQGPIKAAHFAHLPDADCSFAGQEESVEHQLVKQDIYQALLHIPGVSEVQVERNLQEVRPDVSFMYNGTFVAIEVQVSTLSSQDVERRTLAYARKN